MCILTEEVGEVAQSILQTDYQNVSVELVQSAAVIVAWLEDFFTAYPPDTDDSEMSEG